ncbi:MAG TPA: hypothetical protein DIV42_10420 [Alteromonas macleodii]|nr:hypothetical protein [Alteromonas macleodii]
MKITGIKMNRILKKHLALSAALALFSLTSGHAMAQLDKQKVERIDVVGQKTTPQLVTAFEQERFAFLELYNEINNVAKFDMICHRSKPTGSQIVRKHCEPRYLKSYRAMMIQKASNTSTSDNTYINFGLLPHDDDIKFLTKNTREENHDHVAALIATHPELWESFKKLDAIHRKIKQREEGN